MWLSQPSPRRAPSILLALGFSLALSSCSKEAEPPQAPPPSVAVISIGTQDVGEYNESVARTEAIRTVELKARVEGEITKRLFREGETVEKGQLLFEIDRENYQAALTEAEANLSSARAEKMRTERDYTRGKELRPKGFISQSDLDTLASNASQAQASEKAAQAALKNAEVNLSYTRIRAPFSGEISTVRYNVGTLVGPNSDPLATLLKDNPIYANFQINESDYISYLQQRTQGQTEGRIATQPPEDLLTITLILPNGTVHAYPGTINYAGIEVNATTGTVDVRAKFPNPSGIIRPGMYCTLQIESKNKTSQPIVPQYAVQEGQQGKFVLIVDNNNTIQTRNIKVGRNMGALWAVTAGLTPGDKIVVEGLQKVRTGTKVNPVMRYLDGKTGVLRDTPESGNNAQPTAPEAVNPEPREPATAGE
ncbi:efflux RND transporter periplasmic adaptor subunit [Pseudomaricurvus sp.]|uniref:efflux RND transporter periplasmic adaptor subunit n=1 Tax=Pseudomaricurvus sp. TaxID=2004510 RepID=UPI003F6CC076